MCDISDDGDYASVWSERTVRARKTHSCSCCHAVIAPGEQYMRHFSVYDGNALSSRACLACADVIDDFASKHDGMRFHPGYMITAIQHCLDESDEEAPHWQAVLDAIEARRPIEASA